MVEQSSPNQTSEKGTCGAAGSPLQSGCGDSPTYSDAKRLDFTAALSAQIKALHRFKPDFGRQGRERNGRSTTGTNAPVGKRKNFLRSFSFSRRRAPLVDDSTRRRCESKLELGGMCDVHQGQQSDCMSNRIPSTGNADTRVCLAVSGVPPSRSRRASGCPTPGVPPAPATRNGK